MRDRRTVMWQLCPAILVLLVRGADSGSIALKAFAIIDTFPDVSMGRANNRTVKNDESVLGATRKRLSAATKYPKENATPRPAEDSVWPLLLSVPSATTARWADIRQRWLDISSSVRKHNAESGNRQSLPEGAHQCNSYEDCRQYREKRDCRYNFKYQRRECSCPENHFERGDNCLQKVSSSKYGGQSIFLTTTVIVLVIGALLVMCTASGFFICQSFISVALSSGSQTRERIIPEASTQSTDKPPPYDQAISSPAMQILSCEELYKIPPPSYNSITVFQQPSSNY